ncbi:MAG: YbaN family protein [Acidimicrobiia bacterium]|nr:YbaN family protein [Acidimicrobiia bacterium]
MPSPSSRAPQSRPPMVVRLVYVILGLLCLAVGAVGLGLPGLPGTPFLLVAAWLFSMSNERLHRWMLANRWFGQVLSDYSAGLGIPRRIKAVAVGSVIVVVTGSVMYSVTDWWARAALVGLAIIGIVFILTRPTREDVLAA